MNEIIKFGSGYPGLQDYASKNWPYKKKIQVEFFPSLIISIIVYESDDANLLEDLNSFFNDEKIAIDLEWKPDMKISNNIISVFQFCGSNGVFIVTNSSPHGSEQLSDFLHSHEFIGKGNNCDLQKLKQMFDQSFNIIDIETSYLTPLHLSHSFMTLVSNIIGEPCASFKDKSVTLSDWSHHPLTSQQILYAAFDAYAIFLIYLSLPKNISQIPIDSEPKVKHKRHSRHTKGLGRQKPQMIKQYKAKFQSQAQCTTINDLNKDLSLPPSIYPFHPPYSPKISLARFWRGDGNANGLHCFPCDLTFSSEEAFINHVWEMHWIFLPNMYFVDQTPSYIQSTIDHIDFAIKHGTLSQNGQITCSICGIHVSPSFHSFYTHCRIAHRQCYEHPITMSFPQLLLESLKFLHLAEDKKCLICESSTSSAVMPYISQQHKFIDKKINISQLNVIPVECDQSTLHKPIITEFQNQEELVKHIWMEHGELLASLWKHRPVHYSENTYDQSQDLGILCLTELCFGELNRGRIACGFCKIAFDDPGELFVHLFHRHTSVKIMKAEELSLWPLPLFKLPKECKQTVKMMCHEAIISELKKAEMFQKNSNLIICTNCNKILHDKHELWHHAESFHVAISFEDNFCKTV